MQALIDNKTLKTIIGELRSENMAMGEELADFDYKMDDASKLVSRV